MEKLINFVPLVRCVYFSRTIFFLIFLLWHFELLFIAIQRMPLFFLPFHYALVYKRKMGRMENCFVWRQKYSRNGFGAQIPPKKIEIYKAGGGFFPRHPPPVKNKYSLCTQNFRHGACKMAMVFLLFYIA